MINLNSYKGVTFSGLLSVKFTGFHLAKNTKDEWIALTRPI
jgi:hypothetical protein